MKKHNRQYAFRMVELPLGSGKSEFVQVGTHKWLMQSRYSRRKLTKMAGIGFMYLRNWKIAVAKERKGQGRKAQ